MAYNGACLCSDSRVTIAKIDTSLIGHFICHCIDCRQANGSAFSSNILALATDVTIDGQSKTVEVVAESGRTVTRWFCANCGSALGHRSEFMGPLMAIQTGNFADFAKIPITVELYVKDRWEGLPPIPGAGQVEAMLTI